MVRSSCIVVRPAEKSDLDAVNAIVESCVMAWNLPERVKRLSLSSYRYHTHDLHHLEMVLATDAEGVIRGVAAWEPAAAADLPKGRRGMLLHGLYVAPRHQHRGFGSRLIHAALDAVRRHGMNGLLVKAQADAVGFFVSREFVHLAAEKPARDYPHRYWRQVD